MATITEIVEKRMAELDAKASERQDEMDFIRSYLVHEFLPDVGLHVQLDDVILERSSAYPQKYTAYISVGGVGTVEIRWSFVVHGVNEFRAVTMQANALPAYMANYFYSYENSRCANNYLATDSLADALVFAHRGYLEK